MTSNRLYGPLDDVAGDAGYAAGHPQRVGFFTDTSVCIGCKACEVACKEWNGLPDPEVDALVLTGMSYDNTGALGASSWRHVAFIEQAVPPASALSRDADGDLIISAPTGGAADGEDADAGATRWLMASDVCKHCTHAACLDVCPTGALVRTEFGTVIVQPDVCNGCAYCVSACPFGVIDRREDDGRAWKCTMCYDRLRGGLEPACAKACPTDSIQFGPLDELRATAQARLSELHAAGVTEARLYGDDPQDGIGGAGAFFLLLDEPQVYGLPPDPVVTTRDLPSMWRWAGLAAGVVAAGVAVAFAGRKGRP
jgi:formate dehydrogenase iron-sulfur subunit